MNEKARNRLILALFDGCWSGGKDISDEATVSDIAQSVGLSGADIIQYCSTEQVRHEVDSYIYTRMDLPCKHRAVYMIRYMLLYVSYAGSTHFRARELVKSFATHGNTKRLRARSAQISVVTIFLLFFFLTLGNTGQAGVAASDGRGDPTRCFRRTSHGCRR